MTYGPNNNGFRRKSLNVILDEIETSNADIFGQGIIQTSQSPMGQLNGLRADLIATLWEALEDVYQSFDPDQAEGDRLDMLARFRLIARMSGESDASLRSAITNVGQASIMDADFDRAVKNVDGVTWSRIYSNDSGVTDDQGVPGHSVSVAAIGGDAEEIAAVIRRFVVPGISSYGNTNISTAFDGFCREMSFMRPHEIPVFLEIEIRKWKDIAGCPPPTNSAVIQALLAAVTGSARPVNGQDITEHMIRTAISCAFPNVEVVSVQGGRVGSAAGPLPITIDFNEISLIQEDDITVTVTP